MLRDIGDTSYITGTSPTLGVMQRIDSRAWVNLHAFARTFNKSFPGEKLVVIEGARTRPRQLELWKAWKAYEAYLLGRGPWAPFANLAAYPYTSKHDEIDNSTAVDIGNGFGTEGTVRSRWGRHNAAKYGMACTGANFSPKEYWHYEVSINTTTFSSATPGIAITPDAPAPTPTQKEDDDMLNVIVHNQPGFANYAVIALYGPGYWKTINPADRGAYFNPWRETEATRLKGSPLSADAATRTAELDRLVPITAVDEAHWNVHRDVYSQQL